MYKYKCVPNNLGFFKLKPNSIGSQLFPDLEKLVPIGQTKHMSIIASKVVVGYHQDTRTRTSLISDSISANRIIYNSVHAQSFADTAIPARTVSPTSPAREKGIVGFLSNQKYKNKNKKGIVNN